MLLVNTEIKIMAQEFDFGTLYKTDIGEFGTSGGEKNLTSRPMNVIVPDPTSTDFVPNDENKVPFTYNEEGGYWTLNEGIYPDLVVRTTTSGAPKIARISDPEAGFNELYLLITTNVDYDKDDWKNNFKNGAIYSHIASLENNSLSLISSSTNFGSVVNKKTNKVSRWDAVLVKVETFKKEDTVLRIHYCKGLYSYADDYIIINKNGKIVQVSDENLTGKKLGESVAKDYAEVVEDLNPTYMETSLKIDQSDWRPISRRNLPKTVLPEKEKPEPKKFNRPRKFNKNRKFNK